MCIRDRGTPLDTTIKSFHVSFKLGHIVVLNEAKLKELPFVLFHAGEKQFSFSSKIYCKLHDKMDYPKFELRILLSMTCPLLNLSLIHI